MKVAFTGKGGSGKSTLAHRMCRYLAARGFSVLAVDADHNMDLAYGLDPAFAGPFLGNAKGDMAQYPEGGDFSMDPADSFTEKYAKPVLLRIRLMVSGPHTDDVLQGKRCSHSLSSPLKKYFPRLKLVAQEAVVVDEKAGSDGPGTGALRGFDHVFVVAEPNAHSVKAAHQIADILEYHAIPYSFVGNKAVSESAFAPFSMRKKPIWSFPFSGILAGPEGMFAENDGKGLEVLVSVIR